MTDNPRSGGIRGIIQLVILQELNKRLGGIPIYSFFDLVVGTRWVWTPKTETAAPWAADQQTASAL
jgi:hypothetical protein